MIVLTHHKCASTWLTQYLRQFAEMNGFSFDVTQLSVIPSETDISCLINADYRILPDIVRPCLHIIRNPLDLIVSAYYSHLATHSLAGWPQLERQRSVLANASREDGLFLTLAFLERDDFYNGAVGPLHALRHWNYDDDAIFTVRMEDAVGSNGILIGNWLSGVDPDYQLPDPANYAFSRFSGREPGSIDDNSHYRSGIAGEWKSTIPVSLIDYVKNHYRPTLEPFYPEVFG